MFMAFIIMSMYKHVPFLFKGILELGKQVKSLPQVNYNLLKYICK